MEPEWLKLARSLQAIAGNGLEFSDGVYDRERYQDVKAVADRMIAMGSDVPIERIAELFAGEKGYATPKVDVRAVVIRDNRVLLVQEKSDQRWALPGGWAEVNISPARNVEKETVEEAGLVVKAQRLLAVYDRAQHDHPPYAFSVYKLFIHCTGDEGEPSPGLETMNAGFFSETELPPLSVGRVNEPQLRRMFELVREPGMLPDLD